MAGEENEPERPCHGCILPAVGCWNLEGVVYANSDKVVRWYDCVDDRQKHKQGHRGWTPVLLLHLLVLLGSTEFGHEPPVTKRRWSDEEVCSNRNGA